MSTQRTLSTECEATEDVYNSVIGKLYTELLKYEEGSNKYNQIDEKLDSLTLERENLYKVSLLELLKKREDLKDDIDNFIENL